MKYRRNYDCRRCLKPVVYDDEKHTLKCECMNTPAWYRDDRLNEDFTAIEEQPETCKYPDTLDDVGLKEVNNFFNGKKRREE